MNLDEKLEGMSVDELKALLERIFDKTVIEFRGELSNGPCYIWTGRTSSNGYGRISVKGKEHAVHLIPFMILRGRIIKPNELDHTCYEPPCWNPDHLVSCTHQENCLRRRVSRRRAA